MKKVILFLLVAALLCGLLFFTWHYLKTPILNFLFPRQEKLKLINTISNILIPVFALIISSISIFLSPLIAEKIKERKRSRIVVEEEGLLVPTTPEEFLLRKMSEEQISINWIDRELITDEMLRTSGLYLFEGRSKIGKTREAAEFIRQLIEDGIVPPKRVFDLTKSIGLYPTPESARTAMNRKLDFGSPAVFLLDEITRNINGLPRENLAEVLTVIKRCSRYYVIATARSDQIDSDKDRLWLKNLGFRTVVVRPLHRDETLRFVDNLAGVLGVQISDEAREVFAKHSDGSPYRMFFTLKRLVRDGHNNISSKHAEKYIRSELIAAWKVVRNDLYDDIPEADFILKSLDVFYTIGITPYYFAIMDFAYWIAKALSWRKFHILKKNEKRIWEWLEPYGITMRNESKTVRKVIIPDPACEGRIDKEEALNKCMLWFKKWGKVSALRRLIRKNNLPHPKTRLTIELAIKTYFLGKLELAEFALQQAISNNPGFAIAHNILGLIYDDRGKLEDAEVEYLKAIEADPDLAAAHYSLGVLNDDQGKLEDAQAEYLKAIEADPDYADAHYNLGILYKNQGKLEDAQAAWKKAIEADPDYADAYNNLGVLYKDQGKLEDAETAWKNAIKADPNFAAAHFNLGALYEDHGKTEDAEVEYLKAIKSDPDHAAAHTNLGALYHDQGKLEDAETAWKMSIKADPDLAAVHYNLGVLYYDQGKLEDTEVAWKKAIKADPGHAAAHYNLGLLYKNQGKLEEAEASWNKAIEADPDYAGAYNNLGALYKDQGKLEDAQAAYLKAIKSDPDLAAAHYNLGVLYDDQGKLEDAQAEYLKAIEADPDHAAAHYNLGVLYKDQGKLEDAEAAWKKAIKADPDLAAAYINLGGLYKNQGKTEDAEAAWKKAIKADPHDATAHYNLGVLYDDQGKPEAAEAAWKKAIEADPNDAVTHYNLGVLYKDQGKLEEAEAEYLKAIEADPDLAGAYNNLVSIYRMQMKFTKAESIYQGLIKIKPNDPVILAGFAAVMKKLGKHEESQKMFARVREYIENVNEYDQACIEAISENIESSLNLLETAIKKDQVTKSWAKQDPDLENLRNHPRFKELVEEE